MVWGWGSMRAVVTPLSFQDLLQCLHQAGGHRQSLQGLDAWGCHQLQELWASKCWCPGPQLQPLQVLTLKRRSRLCHQGALTGVEETGLPRESPV